MNYKPKVAGVFAVDHFTLEQSVAGFVNAIPQDDLVTQLLWH